MSRRGISELIGDIHTIANSLKGRLGEGGDLQSLTDFQSQLEAWLNEARALEVQQELDTSRLRKTTELRRQIRRRGVDLRGRAAAHLQGHFGKKSQDLREFGLQPRRDPRPAAKTGPPGPEVTPPPGKTPQPGSPEPPVESDSSA
jgi:hypothetical protein